MSTSTALGLLLNIWLCAQVLSLYRHLKDTTADASCPREARPCPPLPDTDGVGDSHTHLRVASAPVGQVVQLPGTSIESNKKSELSKCEKAAWETLATNTTVCMKTYTSDKVITLMKSMNEAFERCVTEQENDGSYMVGLKDRLRTRMNRKHKTRGRKCKCEQNKDCYCLCKCK
jgi:hypothetical protein